eukprot:TRINITY_DN1836_c0_g1_i1.p4 TRINITY_DN1836_c0_g1~~TRINITY_DN1836_c0_g1_i1.p4  ORF type:complete len:215 (-),score=7.74 TRINITY_DN1836_c0_g1_i1:1560-2153(-)
MCPIQMLPRILLLFHIICCTTQIRKSHFGISILETQDSPLSESIFDFVEDQLSRTLEIIGQYGQVVSQECNNCGLDSNNIFDFFDDEATKNQEVDDKPIQPFANRSDPTVSKSQNGVSTNQIPLYNVKVVTNNKKGNFVNRQRQNISNINNLFTSEKENNVNTNSCDRKVANCTRVETQSKKPIINKNKIQFQIGLD